MWPYWIIKNYILTKFHIHVYINLITGVPFQISTWQSCSPILMSWIIISPLLWESKKLGHFFTAYNFRNIKQIFTKFGTNQSLFILNIVPEFI